MLENTISREKRRLIILTGISQDLTHSEIAAQLGTNRWSIKSDIKFMQHNGDLEFKQAEKAQLRVQEKKVLLSSREKNHFKQNERFQSMTGITLQEKSFRNMIDFNKHDLLKILKSKDQRASRARANRSGNLFT
jgi:predicted ArsR family transcriptional regulator